MLNQICQYHKQIAFNRHDLNKIIHFICNPFCTQNRGSRPYTYQMEWSFFRPAGDTRAWRWCATDPSYQQESLFNSPGWYAATNSMRLRTQVLRYHVASTSDSSDTQKRTSCRTSRTYNSVWYIHYFMLNLVNNTMIFRVSLI